MTNQNNKLDEILDSLYCDAWFAGRVAEREQSGIRSVTPKFDEAKQAIQALYAPKPVENGELRETILTEFKQVHKLAPADYTENCTNVVMSIIQAHTNAEIAKVLDRLDDNAVELPMSSGDNILLVPLEYIEAERAKLKEVK